VGSNPTLSVQNKIAGLNISSCFHTPRVCTLEHFS
jgi:hypothetical protein